MNAQSQEAAPLRVGIDLGGTKIAGTVLGAGGHPLAEHRMPAPRHDYGATVRAIGTMVRVLEESAGSPSRSGSSIGIGIPGSVAPASRLVQNANSTWLNGKPFQHDLEVHLGGPVRLANDANCFALSEAVDGAGAGVRSVFGVILGTGCGGGLVRQGSSTVRAASAANGATPAAGERRRAPGRKCWCGRVGCIETWCRTGLEADHTGDGSGLAPRRSRARASGGDAAARRRSTVTPAVLPRGLCARHQHLDPTAAGRRSPSSRTCMRCCQTLRPHTSSPSPRTSSSSRRCGVMPAACAAPRGCGDSGPYFCSHLLGGWKTISLSTPWMANSP